MAWTLACETICGYLASRPRFLPAPHGRFWTIFNACASGGTDLRGALAGPLNMATTAARLDPVMLWFGALALIALLPVLLSGRLLRYLPALLFLMTLAVTAFLYGTPGVNDNHLIDLQAASLILIATQLSRATATQQKWQVTALALAVLFAAIPTLRHFKNHDLRFTAPLPDRARHHRRTSRPILAENPIVPLLAGQRPYVLDAWMLRVLRQRIPGFGDPLLEKLRNRSFGAVVLCWPIPKPATDAGGMRRSSLVRASPRRSVTTTGWLPPLTIRRSIFQSTPLRRSAPPQPTPARGSFSSNFAGIKGQIGPPAGAGR